mmetsp:Transcript_111163/g.313693  ORF Transcript_111163/g.313693 Transcript_111163/m.313693 type:complete len:247 (+) Transcript_111163:827-1567(+)
MATEPGLFMQSLKSSMVVVIPTLNMRSPRSPVKAGLGIHVNEGGYLMAATAAIASQTANKLQKVLARSLNAEDGVASTTAASAARALPNQRLPPFAMALRRRSPATRPARVAKAGIIEPAPRRQDVWAVDGDSPPRGWPKAWSSSAGTSGWTSKSRGAPTPAKRPSVVGAPGSRSNGAVVNASPSWVTPPNQWQRTAPITNKAPAPPMRCCCCHCPMNSIFAFLRCGPPPFLADDYVGAALEMPQN